ncbi:MAG: lysostaphin resistance A-like protein [Limisphaerales bacterium]
MSEPKAHPWTFENLLVMFVAFFGCLLLGAAVQELFISKAMAATPDGKFVVMVIHVLFFNVGGIICIGLLLTLERRGWSESFGLNRSPLKALGTGLGFALIATPVVMILQAVIARLITKPGAAPEVQQIVRTIEQTTSIDQLFFYAFLAIMLAPVIEELLFRGILYRSIKAAGHPHIALWGTSLTFGVIHASQLAIIPLTVLALLLAKLYDRTENILAPILAHATFNAVNFLILLNANNLKSLAGP